MKQLLLTAALVSLWLPALAAQERETVGDVDYFKYYDSRVLMSDFAPLAQWGDSETISSTEKYEVNDAIWTTCGLYRQGGWELTSYDFSLYDYIVFTVGKTDNGSYPNQFRLALTDGYAYEVNLDDLTNYVDGDNERTYYIAFDGLTATKVDDNVTSTEDFDPSIISRIYFWVMGADNEGTSTYLIKDLYFLSSNGYAKTEFDMSAETTQFSGDSINTLTYSETDGYYTLTQASYNAIGWYFNGGQDWSNYEYMVIELAEAQSIGLQMRLYSVDSYWDDTHYAGNMSSTGKVFVYNLNTLTNVDKSSIYIFCFWSYGGTCKIKSVKLLSKLAATAYEYNATEWTSSTVDNTLTLTMTHDDDANYYVESAQKYLTLTATGLGVTVKSESEGESENSTLTLTLNGTTYTATEVVDYGDESTKQVIVWNVGGEEREFSTMTISVSTSATTYEVSDISFMTTAELNALKVEADASATIPSVFDTIEDGTVVEYNGTKYLAWHDPRITADTFNANLSDSESKNTWNGNVWTVPSGSQWQKAGWNLDRAQDFTAYDYAVFRLASGFTVAGQVAFTSNDVEYVKDFDTGATQIYLSTKELTKDTNTIDASAITQVHIFSWGSTDSSVEYTIEDVYFLSTQRDIERDVDTDSDLSLTEMAQYADKTIVTLTDGEDWSDYGYLVVEMESVGGSISLKMTSGNNSSADMGYLRTACLATMVSLQDLSTDNFDITDVKSLQLCSVESESIAASIKRIYLTIPAYQTFAATGAETTIASPYAIDLDELDGVTAYSVSQVEGGLAILAEVDGTVEAATGLVLLSDNDEAISVTLPTAAEGSTVSDNMLVGVTKATAITQGDEATLYVLGRNNEDDDAAFLKVNSTDGITVPAGKAYLSVPTTNADANALTLSFGEATDISSTRLHVYTSTQVYDLCGRRVSNATKGIYIINGKKILK